MKKTCYLIFSFLLSLSADAQMITGQVFVDTNGNGLKDKNEAGVSGVVVSDQVSTVETDGDGVYQFKARGYGFVFISVPGGYKTTKSNW